MAYSHSFTPRFYGNIYSASPSVKPDNLADAIASMDGETWECMAQEIFGVPADRLDLETVFLKAIETDTVGTLSTPVDVWIDDEGFYRVDVY